MIPSPAQALADLALKLARETAPACGTPYARANTEMTSQLLLALAREAETGVAARMLDIEDMRGLLERGARAASGHSTPDASAWEDYAELQPDSLSLNNVTRLHGEGLRRLIALHAWAEQNDSELDHDIWQWLSVHTARHASPD